jgi:6-pyruvoyltetrahydropterin/6-carboxytetrahydropterin synthase
MPRMQLTRKVRFSAAHRYHRPEWTDEQNRHAFGPCANPHGHGHDYVLEVTVEGEVHPLTGFSVDMGKLDEVLREEVMVPFDHQHLNHVVPEFAPGELVPTSENLLLMISRRLAPRLFDMRVVRLRLHENHDFYVEYAPLGDHSPVDAPG